MKKLFNTERLSLGKFKFDLKMKLSTIVLLISIFTVNANTYSQKAKVTLDVKEITLGSVFDEIEAQTEFKFIFNITAVDLNRLVTLKVKNRKINGILKHLLE